MPNIILLHLVCAPSMVKAASGRNVLTAELIDDAFQVFKLEVRDEYKMRGLNQLLT